MYDREKLSLNYTDAYRNRQRNARCPPRTKESDTEGKEIHLSIRGHSSHLAGLFEYSLVKD